MTGCVRVFLALDYDDDEGSTSGCCRTGSADVWISKRSSSADGVVLYYSVFFFVDARCSPLSLHHAVINSTVSCVAPSVSAYNSAPPDLFQASGSNRRSWTVTNCV